MEHGRVVEVNLYECHDLLVISVKYAIIMFLQWEMFLILSAHSIKIYKHSYRVN